MIKPIQKHYDQHRRTSILYFDDWVTMECYMRGGICWPIRYEANGVMKINGYIVVAGQDVRTGKVYVFEQTEWETIENIIGKDKNIRYLGLSHWINRIWNEYYAEAYYYQQDEELARRFRLQILRSKMIQPKPRFVEVDYSDTADMIGCIWGNIKADTVKRKKGTVLEEQLAMVQGGDKQALPAVHALGCCLLGLERFPWREPKERPVQEVLVA